MSFPTSPANNQTALVNGIVYAWNSALGVWKRNGSVNSIEVGQLLLNSAQQSTTNGSGTLIVSGGAGITGNVYTGGIFITGAANGITFVDGTTQTSAGASAAATSAAYDAANTAQSTATAANNLASSAYGQANAANQYANSAYAQANAANQYANSAYAKANTVATDLSNFTSLFSGIEVTQNTRISIIESVNTSQNTRMSVIEGVDTTQNTNITAADTKAQGAFDKANTAPITTTSATAPSSPNIGDMWYDTDVDVLLRYTNDGTSNNWIDITGPTIGKSTYIRPTYLITANVS